MIPNKESKFIPQINKSKVVKKNLRMVVHFNTLYAYMYILAIGKREYPFPYRQTKTSVNLHSPENFSKHVTNIQIILMTILAYFFYYMDNARYLTLSHLPYQ